MFEVVVGNIGTVYKGQREDTAHRLYDEYVLDSTLLVGRAAGEPVALMFDGEILREAHGALVEE